MAWWCVRGFRRQRRFGKALRFVPETELAESIWFHYPRHSVRQRIVMYTDYVQAHSLVSFAESLPGGPIILELGAYHGAYAVLLGALVKEKAGRFIAVEASPANAAILRKNIALNGLEDTVEVVEGFVLDLEQGEILLEEKGSQSTLTASGGRPVISKSITTLLRQLALKRVDLLLMDIEGAEVRVLPAFPWKEVQVGRIYCEMHPGEWRRFGCSPEAMQSVLQEQGLVCLDMYLNPFSAFAVQHYAGPAVIFRP